jgi:sigma-B regulation protein RsbU (phosphoserine phosphatase)
MTMGLVVFLYVRSNLLAQWQDAAVVKLGRQAHHVDMRLSGPKVWMNIFRRTISESDGDAIRGWALRQLEDIEEIERVTLLRVERKPEEGAGLEGGAGTKEGVSTEERPQIEDAKQRFTWTPGAGPQGVDEWMRSVDFGSDDVAGMSPPRYGDMLDHESVSLTSDFLDANGKVVGRLEVVIRFENLVEDAVSLGWSSNERAFLVSSKGNLLACNLPEEERQLCYDDSLIAAAKAMEKEPFGAVIRSSDTSEEEVVGFHRLAEAPWSLVVIAQSHEILAPIYRFQLIYFSMTAVFFVLILLLIRFIAGRTVSSIRDVSDAARRVARGSFDALPPSESRDEVGQLIRSFNEMVAQLDERIRLKESLDLAMQVQQSLLPSGPPRIEGLEIAGESIYCDETGGDYYDFLSFPGWDSNRIGIVVGDVAGHGISAALFMTTVRALLRSRMFQPGSLSQVMNDVNRLLCMDTSHSGDFMTLFLALADVGANKIHWVRAGHAPAILYDWGDDSFEELRGEGAAIGYECSFSFKEYEYGGWNGAKILFLGTDGIWETENPQGEMFGMDRLRDLIRSRHRESPAEIIRAVSEALAAFRQTNPQEDDVTMVVVKSAPEPSLY